MTPDQLKAANLAAPRIPTLPKNVAGMRPRERLKILQAYISAFKYNFISGYQYNIMKRRPFGQIMVTAREIMRDGLPIKCIEACFLGIFLTCAYQDWQRYPVGFKTKVDGHTNAYR
jgi:tubulinyl-Tyr carboxypeptidase